MNLFKDFREKKIIASIALFSAIGLAFFLYGFWLAPLIGSTGKRVVFLTLIVATVGTPICFFIISKAFSLFRKLDIYNKVILVITTLIIGSCVFYITNITSQKNAYFWPLLPKQELEIYVPSIPSSTNEPVIAWIKTTLGEVSYDDIIYAGWTREDGSLYLTDTAINSFAWDGKVGEKATIIFHTPSQVEEIHIYWNGEEEVLDLNLKAGDEYIYNKKFRLPFYATYGFVLLLGSYQAALFFFLASTFFLYTIKKATDSDIKKIPLPFQEKEEQDKKTIAQEVGIVIGFMFLALALRVYNLENLSPYVDEYAHFIAANSILEGVPLGSVYQRSLWIVTLPVTLSFYLFGNELWAARLPGVLFNTLAIIPLYLLTRKINRKIAVLSVFLYASSPWIIATARNTREYAFYPFYFYWIAFGLMKIIEWIPEELSLKSLWKELTRKGRWIAILFLSLPVLYIKIDIYSTFKEAALIYAVFFCFFGIRMLPNKNKITLPRVILLIALLSFSIPVIRPYLGMLRHFNFRIYPTRILLNSAHQWYFQRIILVPIIMLISSFWGAVVFGKRNQILVYIWALFGGSYIVFSVFFVRYFMPRYIIFMEYWFLILMAIGFYMLWLFLKEILSLKISGIAIILLFLLFLNFPQTLLPTQEQQKTLHMGYFPVDGEQHLNMEDLDLFFANKVTTDDVLLTTVYNGHLIWQHKDEQFGDIFFLNLRNNDVDGNKAKIESIIKEHKKGWLIIDIARITLAEIPWENFVLKDTQFKFFGVIGDNYVWSWDTNSE